MFTFMTRASHDGAANAHSHATGHEETGGFALRLSIVRYMQWIVAGHSSAFCIVEYERYRRRAATDLAVPWTD